MFWKKLILINLVILYLAFKIYLLLVNYDKNKESNEYNDKENSLSERVFKGVNCNITNIFNVNKKLIEQFDKIRSTLFFKIFKVNFDSQCNLWTQNMICNFHTCSVCQCEENEIPLPWMQDSEQDNVDKNIEEKFYRWVEKYNYSSPMWLVENEIDSKNGIYVNLEKNPEAFTGYQGQHIWNAIYYENCFKDINFDQMCKEEKTFYKIVSGLHSSINIHLSKNYFDIDQNVTYFNTSMMQERLLNHPDRINNLFFLYSLLLKAFYKAEPLIRNYNFFTGNMKEDNMTTQLLDEIYSEHFNSGRVLCESCLDDELSSTDNFENFDTFMNFNPFKVDELKMRFRNISSIIDCVSCQKCKLHGKLQIYGLATMLKILFSKEGTDLGKEGVVKLKTNEIISFVNLVGKVSRSIKHLSESQENRELPNQDSSKIFTYVITIAAIVMILTNRYFMRHRDQLENTKLKLRRMPLPKIEGKREEEILEKLNKSKANEDYVLTTSRRKKKD